MFEIRRSTQVGRRGAPAKGVGRILTGARVQISPSPPLKSTTEMLWTFAFHKNDLISKKECIIQGNKYRFTILTDRLIRLEYNKEGKFKILIHILCKTICYIYRKILFYKHFLCFFCHRGSPYFRRRYFLSSSEADR